MLSKLYSHWACMVWVIILGAALSFVYEVGLAMSFVSVAVGLFVYGKIALCYTMFTGHGVGIVQGRKLAGLPVAFVSILSVLGALIAGFLLCTYEAEASLLPQTIANLRIFGWSANVGFAIALLHWFSWARAAYSQGSEYDARQELEAKGDSPEVIESKIRKLRTGGVLPSPC